MKRVRVDLEQIASWPNLADAAYKAAKGKRNRPEVAKFFARFDNSLSQLSAAILAGKMPKGIFREFTIRDPKQRTIHAACFVDRVFHHAVINLIGPVLDRGLIQHTYACRPGKGQHAAAFQVQHYLRRYPWYIKIDIDGYFPAIDHQRLLYLLHRRVKGQPFLALLGRVIAQYHAQPSKGLPIGSLTSQHFANFYLNGLDRFVQEQLPSCAYLRYMDDSIWWCDDKKTACQTLRQVREYLREERFLEVKEGAQINRSVHGVTFCGHRITLGALRLTPRKKRRYVQKRESWENAFRDGAINELELQQGYAAVHAITAHINSRGWRRKNLQRLAPPEV